MSMAVSVRPADATSAARRRPASTAYAPPPSMTFPNCSAASFESFARAKASPRWNCANSARFVLVTSP